MATLAQFSKNIRKRGRQVENAGTRFTKAIAKRSLENLVKSTPVDKGVTRSNWRVGIGSTPTSVIPAYAPGRKLGIGETANANAAISAGKARIDSVRGVSGVGLKTSIIIANNAPAIGPLNNGSSKQAGRGFVQTALLEARLSLANLRVFVDGD